MFSLFCSEGNFDFSDLVSLFYRVYELRLNLFVVSVRGNNFNFCIPSSLQNEGLWLVWFNSCAASLLVRPELDELIKKIRGF